MISFLKAASCPHDGTAVLAVLRSPLGGVPDEELARFVSSGGRLNRAVVAPEETERFPNLARTLTLIEAFRSRLPGHSPDDVIRAAIDETPLALLHASTYDGAQRLANLRKLAWRAEGLARQGLSLEETLRALEEEFGGGRTEGDSPLADEEIDAVRILSIHKAKGLEYPVVFLPDIGREEHKRNSPGTEAVPVRHDGDTLIGARTPGNKMNYAWLRHQELSLRHENAEEKRVFYVGCTRAP